MKKGDAEWTWYEGQPSPFEGLAWWCQWEDCTILLPYHETKWREADDSEERFLRKHKIMLVGFCPIHWPMYKKLKGDDLEGYEDEE